jgi:hypothetical protein
MNIIHKQRKILILRRVTIMACSAPSVNLPRKEKSILKSKLCVSFLSTILFRNIISFRYLAIYNQDGQIKGNT